MKLFYEKLGSKTYGAVLCDEQGATLVENGYGLTGIGSTKAEAKSELQRKIADELSRNTNRLTQQLRFVTSHE